MLSLGDRIFLIAAYTIAGLCVVAVIIVAVMQRRRQGVWPYELTHIDHQPWNRRRIYMILMSDIVIRMFLPESLMLTIPVAIAISAVELSLFLSISVVAAFAVFRSFHSRWSRELALQQTYLLIFAAVIGSFVLRDGLLYKEMAWIWILSTLAACFLTPGLARAAYVEYYLPNMEASERGTEPGIDTFRP